MTVEQIQSGRVLLINKPLDWTSFQAVNKIKFKLKREFRLKKIKVGHAGTLDPKATGLLIICIGKATKQISEIQDAPKEYVAKIKLGAQTSSYDTEQPEILHQNIEGICEEKIIEIIKQFVGEGVQIPPVFSALKVDGERAYTLARAGEAVQMKSRKITIHYIRDIKIDLPFVTFTVGCSKGTYIRSLAHDIGQQLGVGAYLYELKRTKIGDYHIRDASEKYLTHEFSFSDEV